MVAPMILPIRRSAPPVAAAMLLGLSGAASSGVAARAAAAPFEAAWRVYGAGVPVLELEAVIETQPHGYRVQTVMRTRGVAALFAGGEGRSQSIGAWQAGGEPRPALFRYEGVWSGRTRRVEVDFAAPVPVPRGVVPPAEAENEPVPPELRRGTVDVLSALAKLSRVVAETGRCDGSAAVFDGRRRTDLALSTLGRERLPAWRDAWVGEALRCGYESRVVAGFRRGADPAEAGRPRQGLAWVATVRPGGPPLPVRVELPSRLFGTVTAYLVRVSPLAGAEQAAQ